MIIKQILGAKSARRIGTVLGFIPPNRFFGISSRYYSSGAATSESQQGSDASSKVNGAQHRDPELLQQDKSARNSNHRQRRGDYRRDIFMFAAGAIGAAGLYTFYNKHATSKNLVQKDCKTRRLTDDELKEQAKRRILADWQVRKLGVLEGYGYKTFRDVDERFESIINDDRNIRRIVARKNPHNYIGCFEHLQKLKLYKDDEIRNMLADGIYKFGCDWLFSLNCFLTELDGDISLEQLSTLSIKALRFYGKYRKFGFSLEKFLAFDYSAIYRNCGVENGVLSYLSPYGLKSDEHGENVQRFRNVDELILFFIYSSDTKIIFFDDKFKWKYGCSPTEHKKIVEIRVQERLENSLNGLCDNNGVFLAAITNLIENNGVSAGGTRRILNELSDIKIKALALNVSLDIIRSLSEAEAEVLVGLFPYVNVQHLKIMSRIGLLNNGVIVLYEPIVKQGLSAEEAMVEFLINFAEPIKFEKLNFTPACGNDGWVGTCLHKNSTKDIDDFFEKLEAPLELPEGNECVNSCRFKKP